MLLIKRRWVFETRNLRTWFFCRGDIPPICNAGSVERMIHDPRLRSCWESAWRCEGVFAR